MNICRDQRTPHNDLSCWAPVSGSFHNIEGFGTLVLTETGDSTREELASIEARRNRVHLVIDWDALGLDAASSRLFAPAVDHFQASAEFDPGDGIPVEKDGGWLFVLREP